MKKVTKNLKIKCDKFTLKDESANLDTFNGQKVCMPKKGGEYFCTFANDDLKYVVEVKDGEDVSFFSFDELKGDNSGFTYKFSIQEVDTGYTVDYGGHPVIGYGNPEEEGYVAPVKPQEPMKAFPGEVFVVNSFEDLKEGFSEIFGDKFDLSKREVSDDMHMLLEQLGYAKGFYRGNVLKHIISAGEGDSSEVKDLLKAMDYIELEVSRVTKENIFKMLETKKGKKNGK